MKVKIDLVKEKKAQSGKHKFLHRLAKAMSELGVTINGDAYEICLTLPGVPLPARCKSVCRLDGLTIDKKVDYIAKNEKIRKFAEQADGTVFQNEFCYQAYRKFLGLRTNKSACILNGAFASDYLPRDVGNFFLANCKWRPHKRLSAIIDAFLLSLNKGVDADLIVTGEVEKKIHHPRIIYAGWQNDKQLRFLLSEAIATFHLSWIDWCPNAMVESIVAGCPVIYTNSGGQPFVGEGSGIAIEDVAWDFRPCDYYNPPHLNMAEVVEAIKKMFTEKKSVENKKLDIHSIAEEYIKFFEMVLTA